MADIVGPEREEIVEDAPVEQIITEDFIKAFEKQAELYQNRYLPICLRLTNEADWVNHGRADAPRYSLQASGAEKVCNPLGIVWDRPAVVKHERDDEKGKFYEYEIEGIVKCRVLQRYGWFTGNCSSRDPFFNARGRFDEGDIRKAAFSNWIVNAVTRLAGIRNPTGWMLEKAGLAPAKIQSIDYGAARSPEQAAGVVSEPQLKRLFAIQKEHKVNDESVRVHIFEKYGYKSRNEITRAHYDAIVAWVQKGGKGNGNAEQGKPGQQTMPGG